MRRGSSLGFALYEVLLGLAIFAIGVIALGRSVGNCLNASTLSAEDARVRNILANRAAEIETAPTSPETLKTSKIDTGYGMIELRETARLTELEEDKVPLSGIWRVTLTAKWRRGEIPQSKQLAFYVYRAR